jgi:hypothetical protein
MALFSPSNFPGKYIKVFDMRVKTWQIILILVLVFLILVNVLYGSSCDVAPYNSYSIFDHIYPYSSEGFNDNSAANSASISALSASYSASSSYNSTEAFGGGGGGGGGGMGGPPGGGGGMGGGNSGNSNGGIMGPPPGGMGPPPPPGGGMGGPPGSGMGLPPSSGMGPFSAMGPFSGMPPPPNSDSYPKEKKEGFLDADSATKEQSYSYLANINSSGECANKSLGLSNSMGYLCLSDEQIKFLRARGGNANTRTDF